MKARSKTIIGHRAIGVKETRIEDFETAVDLGLEMIEFDLRMTGCGELVVFHGPPGSEGKNIIREKNLKSLEKELGFSPPLFKDVIDICSGKILFDIEIKESDILPDVIKTVGKNEDGHVITSFLDSVVATARSEGFESGLILGMWGIGPRRRLSEIFPRERKKESGADFLLPERRIYRLSPDKHQFKNAIIWGVNKPDDIKDYLKNNNLSGIITDHPERAIKIREEIKQETGSKFQT